MSVVTRDKIIERIVSRMGEDNKSDEDIKLIEDLTDTFDDYERRAGEDWRTKYEENDRQWRDRYVARFMNKDIEDEIETKEVRVEDERLSYDDLFKEVEK